MKEQILVDTNLLLLLVVGTYRTDLISDHKKTNSFDIDAFETLLMRIDGADLIVTPNVLTETSNLVSLIGDPHKTCLRLVLGEVIKGMSEIYIRSSEASSVPAFAKLGLTDAGILELREGAGLILTTDLDLHQAALEFGLASENFTNYRYG